MKNKVLMCLVIGAMGMGLVTACDDAGESGAAEALASASAADFEREFKDMMLGTIEASGSDPQSLVYLNDEPFDIAEFKELDFAGICGTTEEGESKNSYMVTLQSSTEMSYEEFDAKVRAVWDYWESLGLSPGYFRPSEASMSIRAETPLGGEVTYSAGRYGEFMTSDSACTEKIVKAPDYSYLPPKSSDTPDF